MKKVIVKQDEQKPVPVEVLAASIREIAQGVKKLREGPLNDKALVLLIQHNTRGCGSYGSGKASTNDIRAVLESMETLEAAYLKKKPKP
jgi:hypothetical protein